MGTRLTIKAPEDYDLPRDVCSYGYFLLAPNYWDVDAQKLIRALELDDGPATAVLAQRSRGEAVSARFDRALSAAERRTVRAQITRMLRLDEPREEIAAFHRLDRRWKKSGRGRLFRSPTMFEDVIKTVTSCNVTWPSTVHMNRRLCEALGRRSASGAPHAFPRPERLRRTRPETLRGRCRVGYRDKRIVELASLFSPRGKRPPECDPAWFEDRANSDDEVCKRLLTLPGIGPYAAANIMQLLGRYSRLALDTESVRHGRSVLGLDGTDREVTRAVDSHYARFGEHRFRSYWFELWRYYERKVGVSHQWRRDEVASAFTASNL